MKTQAGHPARTAALYVLFVVASAVFVTSVVTTAAPMWAMIATFVTAFLLGHLSPGLPNI